LDRQSTVDSPSLVGRSAVRAFRDTSIQRKLTRLTMLTSGVTLLLAGATYVAYDLVTFRRAMARDLTTMAQIIGATSTAALVFDDQKSATQLLSSLQHKRNILSASLYKKDGTRFAEYQRGDSVAGRANGEGGLFGWGKGSIEVKAPIVLDREGIGTIAIRSDLRDFYARLERYTTIGAFVMLVSLVVGFLLSARLQRAISEPILQLAGTAKVISDQKDFSVRAPKSSDDEVGLLIDGFNEMLAQIQKRDADLIEKGTQLEIVNRHKSQFLANMSHELRTPMNAILGYTELIQDNVYGGVPEPIQDVLRRIEKSGRHLLGLINDVLDLSKIEAGHLVLSVGDGSMKEIVYSVVSAMESLATEKGLGLTVTLAPELPPARFDERRMTQVLMNLVGNAIKFTEAGEVRVTVSASDGAFHVVVSDTGPGISATDQERIFEEFQQADTSSTRSKGGTGLGLTIAKRIIEMHGGRMWVESSPGSGARFLFTLPIRPEARKAAP
jgi:signal transduction histidine kinase